MPLDAHQDDLRRHVADAERRPDRRQPVGREQRHRIAHGRRRGARDPARARGQAARRSRGQLDGRRRRRQRRPRPQGQLRRARAGVDLKREATARPRPSRRPATRSSANRLQRLDIPRKSRAAPPTCRTCACPAWCMAAWCGRRVTAPARSVDEAPVEAMPGVVAVVRDGSFLGVVAEREEQAIKAREALPRSAKWTAGPELPDPARIFEVIKSLASKDATIGVKQGAVPVKCPHLRGGLHQALHGARLDRAVVRGRRIQGRQDDGVDAFAGRVPVARRTGEGAEDAGQRDPLRAHRRLGLLRPQRRRRRRARRGAARARGAGPAGAAAMDARRRVQSGSPTVRRW